jgi:hypothetical protein
LIRINGTRIPYAYIYGACNIVTAFIQELSRFAVLSLVAQMSNLLAFLVVYWFDFQHLHLAQVQPQVTLVKNYLVQNPQ